MVRPPVLCETDLRMADDREPLLEEHVTRGAIGAMYTVHNRLGFGFVESVYVGAMELECRKRGLLVSREVPIAVRYDDSIVGSYRADILVERKLIIEVKVGAPCEEHHFQILNYLRASDVEVGLLMYFRRSATFRRFIFRNELKAIHQSRSNK